MSDQSRLQILCVIRASLAAIVLTACALSARAADPEPLSVETRILLGDVAGRIDHLAIDLARQRLYVAELGNDGVGVVDLKTGRLLQTLRGFKEPQGIGYEPTTDTIYVANGGDGSVRLLSATDFKALGSIGLGADADNVRIDPTGHRVYVGYGDGAIAVIDAATRKRVADLPLAGHPEGFQLEPDGDRLFVNVPDAGHIAIVSRETKRALAAWSTGALHANYPLALDPVSGRVIVAFRLPARLQAFDWTSGRTVSGIDICSDSDDVFVDSRRHRLYVICGEGFVETLDTSTDACTRAGRLATVRGSRTGLFVPELDRLFVAVRASSGEPAAVWVLRTASADDARSP